MQVGLRKCAFRMRGPESDCRWRALKEESTDV